MLRKLGANLHAFASDRTGVAAIEFALLAWPFFGIVLMIINTLMVSYFRSSLDGAVQNLATDLRSGGTFILGDARLVDLRTGNVTVDVAALRTKLRTRFPPGMDASKVMIEVFRRTDCTTNVACWDDAYSNLAKAQRKTPTFNANSAQSSLNITGSSAGSQAVEFGAAFDSQYMVVYYPMPALSVMFARKDAVILPPTTVTGSSKRVFGLVSTAMWINDPSVGVF